MKFIQFIPTLKNYFKWKKMLKQNKEKFYTIGFDLNWLNQLVYQIKFEESDIYKIESFKHTIQNFDTLDIEDENYIKYLDIVDEIKMERFSKFIKDNEKILYLSGLIEFASDSYAFNNLDEDGYIHLLTISYQIKRGINLFTFLIDLPLNVLFLFIILYKYIKK